MALESQAHQQQLASGEAARARRDASDLARQLQATENQRRCAALEVETLRSQVDMRKRAEISARGFIAFGQHHYMGDRAAQRHDEATLARVGSLQSQYERVFSQLQEAEARGSLMDSHLRQMQAQLQHRDVVRKMVADSRAEQAHRERSAVIQNSNSAQHALATGLEGSWACSRGAYGISAP